MKIVIPVDSSSSSQHALTVAREYADKFPAEIYLINVQNTPMEMAALHQPGMFPMETTQQLESLAMPILTEAAKAFADYQAMPVHKVVLYGHASDQICSYAEEVEADLIIIGSRGLSSLKRFLLGSTTNQVVPHAPCSVLVIKEKHKK